MTHRHYAIPCRMVNPRICRSIARVLRQIRQRAPEDFTRLRSLVRGFVPLPREDERDGTMGRWRSNRADTYDFDAQGVVQLSPASGAPVAVVAHELGHVCTRDADFENRNDSGDDEWASEMCADWYAYKWGFGRQIARHRRSRSLAHHGPPPRSEFTMSFGGHVSRYRVTRGFRVRFLQTETVEGQVIETAAQRRERIMREFHEVVSRRQQ